MIKGALTTPNKTRFVVFNPVPLMMTVEPRTPDVGDRVMTGRMQGGTMVVHGGHGQQQLLVVTQEQLQGNTCIPTALKEVR
jgi:hypothetical protein